MNPTAIEWTRNPDGTQGYTANPFTGCLGPGGTFEEPKVCHYCYARGIARRFGKTEKAKAFLPEFHEDRADKLNDDLNRVRKPVTVFVGSMCDMFGDWIPSQLLDNVLTVLHNQLRHTFLLLTKNPKRYGPAGAVLGWPPHIWRGATVTNQEDVNLRVPQLMSTLPHMFISAEPLLGPLDLGVFLGKGKTSWLDWLIIGAQTGPGAKPPDPEWVRSLTDQALARGVPVFHKYNLGEQFSLRMSPGIW